MILVNGAMWGTAREIADQLGRTEKSVRRWYERGQLAGVRMTDDAGRPQVRHPLTAAAGLDARIRRGGHGQRRA